jgi:hypothetical protein
MMCDFIYAAYGTSHLVLLRARRKSLRSEGEGSIREVR